MKTELDRLHNDLTYWYTKQREVQSTIAQIEKRISELEPYGTITMDPQPAPLDEHDVAPCEHEWQWKQSLLDFQCAQCGALRYKDIYGVPEHDVQPPAPTATSVHKPGNVPFDHIGPDPEREPAPSAGAGKPVKHSRAQSLKVGQRVKTYAAEYPQPFEGVVKVKRKFGEYGTHLEIVDTENRRHEIDCPCDELWLVLESDK